MPTKPLPSGFHAVDAAIFTDNSLFAHGLAEIDAQQTVFVQIKMTFGVGNHSVQGRVTHQQIVDHRHVAVRVLLGTCEGVRWGGWRL